MNNSKSLGLAIVGYGGMGSQHAENIRSVEDFHLVGTYDIKPERLQLAKSRNIFPFSSYDALLASPEVDTVLIATPNHLHRELSIRALKAGKNVICEKPVTLNAAELTDILAAAHECGKVFTVHQNRRWDEDFRSVKAIFDQGLLGKVFTIESRVMGSQGIPGDWRTEPEYGGGMLLDWGIHLIDQILWMVPERLCQIYCRLGYRLGGKCDDSVRVLFTFESGLEVLAEVGTWNMEPLPRWYVAGIGGALTIQDFWFTSSSLTLLKRNILNQTRPIDAGKGITKTMAPRDPDTLEISAVPHVHTDVFDFYRNAAAVIRGTEKELFITNAQSLRVMRVIDAARRSAELNSVIDFDDGEKED